MHLSPTEIKAIQVMRLHRLNQLRFHADQCQKLEENWNRTGPISKRATENLVRSIRQDAELLRDHAEKECDE